MKYPLLYKRSTLGKISTWTIETQDDNFRTISGYLDGLKITSSWTKCTSKNINKKNATTPTEQAEAEAKAMFDKRKALGYWEDKKDIDTPVYFEPMLAKDYFKEEQNIFFPVYSDPKLDGIRCIIRSDGMWSRKGKKIISAPHIYESLIPLFEEDDSLIFDGELFAEKETASFNTIISCVRKTKPEYEDLELSKKYIKYHIYDLPCANGNFTDRKDTLNKINLPECCVKVVTTLINNKTELQEQYIKYIEQGYEGQIIRINAPYENKRSKYLLKHKTFFDEEFEIKGVEEGIGKLSGKVGTLIFELNGKQFNAAVNGDHDYLERLFKEGNLVGKIATVKYFELTEDLSVRFPKVIAIRDYE